MRDIPYYQDYVSKALQERLFEESRPVNGIKDLVHIGEMGGLETKESFIFLCELYDKLKEPLNRVLQQRIIDREFIDSRTKSSFELNRSLNRDYLDPNYETVIGQKDSKDRVVVGPLNRFYCQSGVGQKIKELPDYLKGYHVTLFGPPDDAKLSINAMNAFHRKLKDEPAIVGKLLEKTSEFPKWGADDEDSKTPLRDDLISAGVNLTECFNREISFADSKKEYHLEKDKLSLPIKRFPGLAMPCLFLFFRENPIPLHLYDFALHVFENWKNQEALSFYVPKLETPEEAAYIRLMIETSEKMLKAIHEEYILGSIRLFIVLENPRLIFRTNELIDELYPYFAGASLGWHDYLASTARLFKEDANYRIPVKADPNIVIKYIKASHELLAEVVGSRGGIKIGGMYGVLPIDNDLKSESFQLTIRGYIKDVITQLKRDLSGFWVAHPDFVRLGLALVEAWKIHQNGDVVPLETLITDLLNPKFHAEILKFIRDPDLVSLDLGSPLYARALIVADMKESQFIANNHPDEIRYNVFQSLQYLTDWLSGNGCVALPAHIDGVSVRVMDDLATAERSRWEVWHEIYHGRFSVEKFLAIAAEEMLFIRKDLSHPSKIVQVKWTERTEKWYPVAYHIMVLLMTQRKPVEFASELLLPFTVPSIRNSLNPLEEIQKIDFEKYSLDPYIQKFNFYFAACSSEIFAVKMAGLISLDLKKAEHIIKDFDISEILSAANFHGDIGESKRTLDHLARHEQGLVEESEDKIKAELRELGNRYLKNFGFKFLISAQGQSAKNILERFKHRIENSREIEITNAKEALWQITKKRILLTMASQLEQKIAALANKHQIKQAQVSASAGLHVSQDFAYGSTLDTSFQLASLSKSFASCFAIGYFQQKNILLSQSVNALFDQTSSDFRIVSLDSEHPEWANQVTIKHLMEHTALNMHYVNGIPLSQDMPRVASFLENGNAFSYTKVGVNREPGLKFQYSGGGFLVLEHLIESLEGKNIQELTQAFLNQFSQNLSFDQKVKTAAEGYLESGMKLKESRKMFPAFAAGAMGTSRAVLDFLSKLTKAYRDVKGSGPISHSTAVQMLFGRDKSSRTFMGADMGLGIFTLDAGENRFALHQGANDGFRSLFTYCYDGPDRGKGFVILCSGELNAVLFIGEAAKLICRELNLTGVNTSLHKESFDPSAFAPEEVVNQAYKNLIFNAFERDLPERITNRIRIDPILNLSLAKDAEILQVSNQGFARAENLFSAFSPAYDPELYGRQGKVMDSWESVRHNPSLFDFVIFNLKKPEVIRFVLASTQFHLGNQAPAMKLEAFDFESSTWVALIEKTSLKGHAIKYFTLNQHKAYQKFRVSQIPDGGLTRLGLFNKVVSSEEDHEFSEKVPQPLKPLSPQFTASKESIETNLKRLKIGQEFNVASLAYGARIIKASNEHYGPAIQIISPYPPLHMFDGFESARSREAGHSEEVLIALARPSNVHRIEIDFSYFKNNNPLDIEIFGISENQSIQFLPRTNVKAYAGNIFEFKVDSARLIDQLKIKVFPDGGMNRVRVFTKA